MPEAGVEQPPTRPLQPGSPVSPSRQPSSDTAAAEDLVGQRIANRYTLLRLLGVGGMGAVFLARDDELDDLVALKKLHSRTAECASTMGILRREVRLARRVTHRNVARIYELGEHDKDRFLTMEYVAGNSLAALMERGRLPLMRSIAILEEVCAGLQAVHDAGIIHRDVKPHHVLVAHDGRVVISDFGVAGSRLDFNRSHQIPVGTPAYMA
ncbi:MAG: serine/threonine-protein kinase, partial [Myxococcota bacterium]